MSGAMRDHISTRLAEIRASGAYKHELVMTTAQDVHVELEGRGVVVNLCANNHLGLANHPAIVEAARDALDRWGYGMASVRFICGT
jgi:glycine C-acetyltransferase